LERVRGSFRLQVCGYVVMPEHVHLLLSEPQRDIDSSGSAPLKPKGGLNGPRVCLNGPPVPRVLADALKSLKQGVSRRLIGDAEHFWQKRYYDCNIRDYPQFVEKLRYIHRNPVKAGLCEVRKIGSGAVFATTQLAVRDGSKSSRNGQRENANERRGKCVRR
jgi:putative transposase